MSILSLFRMDDTDSHGTLDLVRSGIEFRGTNLWMMILAMFIASIGLNTNSTAVIIGAMLISPLMGPIVCAGVALGAYDNTMLKRALINLAIMTVASLLASAAYFSLTPLQQASSEMLARTTPTFFDVLIAFFGGSAMIVTISRKSRSSNALAGVAIATALMPPLCTAGYGLATREWTFLAGALYLYLINSIFIGLAAFIFSKYLKLASAEEQPAAPRRRQVIATIAAIVVFVAPSIWFAVDMSLDSAWGANVRRYVDKTMNFPQSRVMDIKWNRKSTPPSIEVSLWGAPLGAELQNHLKTLLPEYKLEGAQLTIIQADPYGVIATPVAVAPAVTPVPTPAPVAAAAPAATPAPVEIPAPAATAPVATRGDSNQLLDTIEAEAELAFPELERVVWGDLALHLAKPGSATTAMVFATFRADAPAPALVARFQAWLRLRTGLVNLTVY